MTRPPASSDRESIRVCGTVSDEVAQPVSGARVALGAGCADTDRDGRFELDAPVAVLIAAPPVLRVSCGGFADQLVSIPPARAPQVDVTLVRERILTGRVIDTVGAVVDGAVVSATAGELAFVAAAGPDGRFAIRGLPAGPVDVCARAQGFAPTAALAVLGSFSDPINLVLVPGRRLDLAVTTAIGLRLAGAKATIRPAAAPHAWAGGAPHAWTVASDSRGVFPAVWIPTSRTLVEASCRGHRSGAVSVPGGTSDQTRAIVLRESASTIVAVRVAPDRPVGAPDAIWCVCLAAIGSDWTGSGAVAQGCARVRVPGPGAYLVGIRVAPPFAEWSSTALLPADPSCVEIDDAAPRGFTEIRVRAPSLRTLAVTVVTEATDTPVAGARVALTRLGAPAGSTPTVPMPARWSGELPGWTRAVHDCWARLFGRVGGAAARTDAEGVAVVLAPDGPYRVSASITCAQVAADPVTAECRLPETTDLQVALSLHRRVRAEGRVRDQTGAPLVGSRVVLVDADGGVASSGDDTRSDGSFRVWADAPGTYRLQVSDALGEGLILPGDWVIPSGPRDASALFGQLVLRTGGAERSLLSVRLWPDESPDTLLALWLAPEASTTVGSLAPGRYWVQAIPAGVENSGRLPCTAGPIVVAGGETREVRLTPIDVACRLRPYRADAHPLVRGARARVVRRNLPREQTGWVELAADGTVTVRGFGPDEYVLELDGVPALVSEPFRFDALPDDGGLVVREPPR